MSKDKLGKTITIDRLSKSYAEVLALKDVSLQVAAGEFCTLLGASGSGKTSLLKVIAGFESHDQGAIQIDGNDVSATPVAKRNIGMVFQNYALFPHLTVFDNVAFGLRMRNFARADIEHRVSDVLNLVSLKDFNRRFPHELSGGQQQRVALARALVVEPDILLMDEPLGALDKNLRQQIQLQLKQLHQDVGATTIYVTHDQEEALHLSDRIVILDSGCVVQSGSPRELYLEPVNRFVAGFLGECNFISLANGEDIGLRPEAFTVGTSEASHDLLISLELETVVFTGADVKLIGRYLDQQVVALIRTDELERLPVTGDIVVLAYASRSILHFR